MSDKLIAFYSRADENYVNGTIKKLDTGNTEIAAGIIQELTGADMFKIDQVQEYAKDYNTCIEQAQADQKRNARPELKEYPENLEQYDTIYLGFPNYWGTMPMAVFTFLGQRDGQKRAGYQNAVPGFKNREGACDIWQPCKRVKEKYGRMDIRRMF